MKMCETTNMIKIMVVQYLHSIPCFTYFRALFLNTINFVISLFYVVNEFCKTFLPPIIIIRNQN